MFRLRILCSCERYGMFETTEYFKCIFCEIEKTKRKYEMTHNDYKVTRDYSNRNVYEQNITRNMVLSLLWRTEIY